MEPNVEIEFDPTAQGRWRVKIRLAADGTPDGAGAEAFIGDGKRIEDAAKDAAWKALDAFGR